MCLSSVLRDDVDDAVYGVRSPNGSTWTADDFNAIDIFERGVLNFPIGSSQQGCVNRASVDQNKDRPGEPAAETTNAYRPFVRIDSRDFDSRCQAERVWNSGYAG